MSEAPKRFEDWNKCDCNECANYWQDSCDGIKKGATKQCNSFLATRSVVIPAKIKDLEKCVKWLTVLVAILVGWNIGQLIAYLLRWF
jgi:hypothetical protein